MDLNFKTAWGVELGNSSVSAVKISKVKGVPKIVDHHIIPYESSIEKEDEFHEKSVLGLSRLKVERNIKKSDPLITSIQGRSVFARSVELPPMDPKRIPELIKYEASQQIPFPIEDVVWDYDIVQTTKDDEISATLFAVRKEEINSLISVFNEAGLQLQGIQSSLIALLNYVRHDLNPQQPCVLIDVKSSNIDFIIHDNNSYWQRNITRGGNDINKALMTKFKISFSQAEELKRSMDSSKQAAKIFQVVEPVFKSMANEIQRSIGHYKSQHNGTQLNDALLLGNTLRMTKLVEYFKKNLRMNLELVSSLNNLSDGAHSTSLINKELPSLSIPIGLALQGTGLASVQTNLIPTDVIASRTQEKKTPWLVASSLLFLAAGGINFQSISQANEDFNVIFSKPTKKISALKKKEKEIENQKKKIGPKRQALLKWGKLLRDPETLFPRDAHIFLLSSLHDNLYQETTDDRQIIFIEKIEISKSISPKKEKVIQKIEGLPELRKATKVFQVTLTGTFFEQPGDLSGNLRYVKKRVVDRLNANKEVFFGWSNETLSPVTDTVETSPMRRFVMTGYFLAKKYEKL